MKLIIVSFSRAEYYGSPSPRWRGAQQLKYFVPKLLIQGPEKLSTSYTHYSNGVTMMGVEL